MTQQPKLQAEQPFAAEVGQPVNCSHDRNASKNAEQPRRVRRAEQMRVNQIHAIVGDEVKQIENVARQCRDTTIAQSKGVDTGFRELRFEPAAFEHHGDRSPPSWIQSSRNIREDRLRAARARRVDDVKNRS